MNQQPFLRNLLFSVILMFVISCKHTPTPPDLNTNLGPQVRFGELFHDVQMAGIFPDSKTFADATPKVSDKEILDAYRSKKGAADFGLAEFVEVYFDMPPQIASDFESNTKQSISAHINQLWPVLTRQPDSISAGTLIPLPHPYIVPGGRFREIYYWDSYFTMLGLQVSESHQGMIENMVKNFAYLIESVGFIPNGNRTYYLGRSQPPFFSVMVQLLSEIKGKEVLTTFLPAMEKEYNFWMEGKDQVTAENRGHRRVVFLSKGIVMNRYWDDKAEPRPESYKEDVELAESTDRPKEELYRNLRAACESGWDFSTRWFRDGESLKTIRTTELVPVDLNSLMFHLEMTLSEAHELQGNTEKSGFYLKQARSRQKGIMKYCWDEKNEWFTDFDFVIQQSTRVPTLAMVTPLFFNISDETKSTKVAAHIESQFLHAGGVSTTLFKSGQQWDAPNGWAPLQWMTIKGLRNYQHMKLADDLAKRWVEINTRVYKTTGKLTEKYNVMDMELEAGGGEYENQDGFGWTNGVLARLLSEKPVL